MRYWDSKQPKSRKRTRSRRAPRPSIASGGSLRNSPFLRKFYQHQAVISEGLQKFFFFLILATLLYAFILGDGGAIRIISLRQKASDMENNIEELKKSVAILEREIDLLQDDPFYMEKLGRERYGYIYPGEKMYKIVPKTDGTTKLDRQ